MKIRRPEHQGSVTKLRINKTEVTVWISWTLAYLFFYFFTPCPDWKSVMFPFVLVVFFLAGKSVFDRHLSFVLECCSVVSTWLVTLFHIFHFYFLLSFSQALWSSCLQWREGSSVRCDLALSHSKKKERDSASSSPSTSLSAHAAQEANFTCSKYAHAHRALQQIHQREADI